MKTQLKKAMPVPDLIRQRNLLIAGPCSAESEAQVLSTALALAAVPEVQMLRAGVWKPRTSPGMFEGAGIKALPWLVKARSLTGLPFGLEVATARHAEDALSFDADYLWIGARTTVNPFSVQHIADALRGTNIPVLIKNPVSADLKLWAGAVERLHKSGVRSIGLIHRGFTSYGELLYRNSPLWQIPIEMKRMFPLLPMIADPSHICGKKDLIAEVSQRSIDLGFDGLMLEAHIHPQEALTDRDQQLSPRELGELAGKLCRKKLSSDEPEYMRRLQELRGQIDCIDHEILQLIARRMYAASGIGELKKKNGVTVFQSNRWEEILRQLGGHARKLGLNPDFVKSYMEVLHIESIRMQENSLS